MSASPGRKTTLILDLDGTLLRCNSFTLFVKFLFRRIPRLRPFLLAVVALRKARLISHAEAKERIILRSRDAINRVQSPDDSPFCKSPKLQRRGTRPDLLQDFLSLLREHINPEVAALIPEADRTILATAAPALYALPFARMIGIPEATASHPGEPENKGEQKLASVRRLGVTFDADVTVVSDHTDDLPLFKANAAGRNLLVTPDGIQTFNPD